MICKHKWKEMYIKRIHKFCYIFNKLRDDVQIIIW